MRDVKIYLAVEGLEAAKAKLKAADDALAGIGATGTQTKSAVATIADGLTASRNKVIQDAVNIADAITQIGGASRVTEADLKKAGSAANAALVELRKLGVEPGPQLTQLATHVEKPTSALNGLMGMAKTAAGVIGVTFTAGAVMHAIDAVGDWGGQIEDTAKKLGIGTDAVQRLDYAAKQNGASIDQVGDAMTQLGKRVVEGKDSTVGALETLGLTMDGVLAMAPEQRFMTVAAAIDRLQDPAVKASVSLRLMGESGSDLLPMFTDLLEDMHRAPVASAGMVQAADDLGDAWDSLKTTGTGLLAGVIVPFAPALQRAAVAAGSYVQSMYDLRDAQKAVWEEAQARKSAGDVNWLAAFEDGQDPTTSKIVELQIARITDQLQKGAPALETYAIAGRGITTNLDEAQQVMSLLDKRTRERIESSEKHARQLEKERQALQGYLDKAYEMDTAGRGKAFFNTEAYQDGMFQGQVPFPTYDKTYLQAKVGTYVKELAGIVPNALQHAVHVESAGEEIAKGLVSGMQTGFSSMGPAVLNAITGGGSISQAVGSSMGLQLTKSMFGGEAVKKTITDHLGASLGGAAAALLPGLGALMGPLISGVGKLFGKLFGGPSEEEVQGRAVAAQFRSQVESMLTDQQRLEAGNDEWKTSVIGVRDAYLAAGRTEADALAVMDKLWRAEKEGPEAVQRVIEEINRTMKLGTTEAVATVGAQAVETIAAVTASAGESLMQLRQSLYLGKGGTADNTGGAGALETEWSAGDDIWSFIKNNGLADLTRFAENYDAGSDARNRASNEAANWMNDHPGEVLAAQEAARQAADAEMAERRRLGFMFGGEVPEYFAAGGAMRRRFGPRGTDTVPAWLTPGEGVLNVRAMRQMGVPELNARNRGERPGASSVDVTVNISASVHESEADFGRRVLLAMTSEMRRKGVRFARASA